MRSYDKRMLLETYHLSVPASAKGEDRADILRLDTGVVMVVADGVGGRPGGAEAATLLVENVVNYFVHADYEVTDLALVQMLTEIDQALSSDENAGETTAVVAVVTEEGVVGAFVGDSDAYLFLPDGTHPGSFFGPPRTGIIRFAGRPPEAGGGGVSGVAHPIAVNYQLTQGRRKPYLGYGAAWPEPFNAELRDGTLLLASDGLWKYADLDRIADIVRSTEPLDAVARRLVDAARLPNGTLQDDITVALCRR